jgi:hypothetical protein
MKEINSDCELFGWDWPNCYWYTWWFTVLLQVWIIETFCPSYLNHAVFIVGCGTSGSGNGINYLIIKGTRLVLFRMKVGILGLIEVLDSVGLMGI